MKMTFNAWVFTRLRPRMYCKPTTYGFQLVPAKFVEAGRDAPWIYALVNKDKKMYMINFTSEEHLIDAIFNAKEIWYGPMTYLNELYNKRNEMLIEYDLSDHS